MNSENSEQPNPTEPTEEDLDSDVGTIFSDEEEGCKVIDDEDDEDEPVGSDCHGTDEESDSSLGSDFDDTIEKCPICLQRFTDQEIGSPEMCEHQFCLRCITAWSKKVATCPVDRKFFSTILVKRQWNGEVVRIEDVKFQNAPNEEEQYDSNPTYCEVCGRCDREDRLLLCDGCDLGYHLECLDPPLEYVPIEDWFCLRCIAAGLNEDDDDEHSVAVQPSRSGNTTSVRIPRTGQSLRILQSILPPDSPPGPNAEPSARAPARTRRKRTTRRKTTKSRTTRRKTAAAGGTRKKRRSRRRRTRRRRVAVDKRPNTARGRIAHQLGIMPPLPGQVYVGLPPACRTTGSSTSTSAASTSTSINSLRYSAGITPLRMFGAPNDLSDLVDSWSDEEGPVSAARFSSVHQPFGATLKGPPEIVATVQPANCDVLGLIMKKQYILHQDKNITIARDGTLVPSLTSSNLPDIANTVAQKSPKSNITFSPSRQSNVPSPTYTHTHPRMTTCGLTNGQGSSGGNSTQHNNSNQQTYGSTHQNSSETPCRESQRTNEASGSSSQSSTARQQEVSNSLNLSRDASQSSWGSNIVSDGDNEDDFDIYSDIEEQIEPNQEKDDDTGKTDLVSAAETGTSKNGSKSTHPGNSGKSPVGEDDHDSDFEMVIDEASGEKIRSPQKEPETLALAMASQPPGNETPGGTAAGMMGTTAPLETELPDSPESIPLPDSPPPSDMLTPDNPQKDPDPPEETEQLVPRPIMEYDPSEPLTSSDEDEHSRRNVEKRVRNAKKHQSSPPKQKAAFQNQPPPARPSPTKKSVTKEAKPTTEKKSPSPPKLDLSSIPIPPEENKRPVIHFSIPTRHKLLPISSLMKRQKGLAKKDVRSEGITLNLQSEISKAFGNDGSQEDSELKDGSEDEENLPKISLVAEIFGSDDDDDEAEIESAVAVPQVAEPVESDKQNESTEQSTKQPEPPIDITSGRWKTVSDEPLLPLPPPPAPETVAVAAAAAAATEEEVGKPVDSEDVVPPDEAEEEPDIIEIVTINCPPRPRRLMGPPLVRRDLETISDSDSDIEVIELSNEEGGGSGGTAKPSKEKSRTRSKTRSKSPSRSRSPHSRRRKRRHSASSESFCEEGEILDANHGKKRKRDKRRKISKRKLSREKGVKGADKNSSGLHSNISSEDEDKGEGSAVSWKKPSKKSHDRSYRSGKSKPDNAFSREKDPPHTVSYRSHGQQGSTSPERRAGSPYRRSHSRYSDRYSRSPSPSGWSRSRKKRSRSAHSDSYDSPSHRRSSSRRRYRLGHSRSPSKSPEPIRSRSLHVSKTRTRSPSEGSRERDRSHRRKAKKRSVSRSGSISPVAKGHKKAKHSGLLVDPAKKKKSKLGKRLGKLPIKTRKKIKERLREREKKKAISHKSRADMKPVGKIKTKEKGDKKKKKREKSLSPVKAIVADGDSIVVSLSFQKEPSSHKSSSEKNISGKENKSSKKSSKKSSSESAKFKEGGNLPRSPTVNKNLDLGTEDLSSNSESSAHNYDREVCAPKVSSSADGSSKTLGRYEETMYSSSIADSSKAGNPEAFRHKHGGALPHTDSTEVQGDPLVTSTRDSLEPSVSTEEDYATSAVSPVHPKSADATKQVAPNVSSTAHSPRVPGAIGGTNLPSVGTQPQSQSSTSSSSGQKSVSGPPGGLEPLPPVVPPPLPQSQSQSLRYPPAPASMFNPVLATVASALFAVRQQTPAALGDQQGKGKNMLMMKNNNSRSQGKGNRSTGFGGDSPMSPNSSDGDDLFEPPSEHGAGSAKKSSGGGGQPNKSGGNITNLFDSLFGSEPSKVPQRPEVNKPMSKSKSQSRPGPRKVQKKESGSQSMGQNVSCDINLNEDVPASAVELSVQEKLLKKLNRQERVVEEVKLCLKPHYIKKHVNKEEYKEILRRAVPKVCHSKTGEINPFKIRELVEAYVRKFRHSRKKT